MIRIGWKEIQGSSLQSKKLLKGEVEVNSEFYCLCKKLTTFGNDNLLFLYAKCAAHTKCPHWVPFLWPLFSKTVLT